MLKNELKSKSSFLCEKTSLLFRKSCLLRNDMNNKIIAFFHSLL